MGSQHRAGDYKISIVRSLVFLSLATAAGVLFGAFLSTEHVTDPFLYYDIAFVESLEGDSVMDVPPIGPFQSLRLVEGRQILMAQLTNATALAPEELQFLPIGTLFISITLFALGRSLLRSDISAAFITVYLTVNLSHATATFSVFGYALALPIFLGTVLLSIERFNQRRVATSLVILLCFVAAHLVHYTVATWIMLFLLGANLAFALRERGSGKREPSQISGTLYLLLAAMVIFLAFNETPYQAFLPLVSPETFSSAVDRLLALLAFGRPESASPYLYSRGDLPSLVSTLTLAIIMAPIAVFLAARSVDFLRGRKSPLDAQAALVVAGILVLGFIDSALYSIRGSISTKAFSMLFPLVSVLVLSRFRAQFGIVFAALLLATSLVKVGVFYADSYIIGQEHRSADPSHLGPSEAWLTDYSPTQPPRLATDLALYGKYLVRAAGNGSVPTVVGLSTDIYEVLTHEGPRPTTMDDALLVVDQVSSEPAIGFVFQALVPLDSLEAEIRHNPAVDRVYDDGTIWVGLVRSSAAP